MMATTLDHTSYPDIVDRIIALSPDDTLPQLRLVSRYCREAVDARQLSHAVLEVDPRRDCPPWFSSSIADRSWPFLVSPAGGRLPYLPNLVHTLDHRAAAHPGKQLSNDFNELHTLRRMRGAYVDPVGYFFPEPHFQPRARTIVDFIEGIRVRFAEGDDGSQARQYVDSTLHATQSYVLHLRVIHAGARPPAIALRNALGATRFTLVLWHGHDARLELPHLGVYSALETFLREWDGGELSITLVGMEAAAAESSPEASWAVGGNTAQELWDGWMAYLADEAYVELDERPAFLANDALVEQVRRAFRAAPSGGTSLAAGGRSWVCGRPRLASKRRKRESARMGGEVARETMHGFADACLSSDTSVASSKLVVETKVLSRQDKRRRPTPVLVGRACDDGHRIPLPALKSHS